MLRSRRAVTGLSLLLASTIALAGQSDPSAIDAGWYRGADSKPFLLTLGASPGLRYVDLDKRIYEHLDPLGDHTYSWNHANRKLTVRILGGNEPRLEGTYDDGEKFLAAKDASYGYTVKALSYRNGKVTLNATLLLPIGGSRVPGVVIAHGSGESHRDNLWYQHQADFLAKHGIAVVLPDKRGCGQSTGDWHTAGFEELADDVLGGVDQLRKQPNVDISRIGILGLSQGGWVAPLAANRSSKVRFVIDVSGAAVTPGEQDRFEIKNSLIEHGLTKDETLGALAFQDAAQSYIRNGDWKPYIAQRDAAMTQKWKPLADEYPKTPKDWYWSWWRRIIDYDPVKQISLLKVPCLVVYGAKDEFENVPVLLSVHRLSKLPSAGKSLTTKVFPQSGHAMGDPKTGWILDDYLQFLSDWIGDR